MTQTTDVAAQLEAMLNGFALQAAPASPEVAAEQAWRQAWATMSKKQQDATPRVAVVEVTPHGDRCHVTLHNADGLGEEVAVQRAAALMAAHPGKTFAVRLPQTDAVTA